MEKSRISKFKVGSTKTESQILTKNILDYSR